MKTAIELAIKGGWNGRDWKTILKNHPVLSKEKIIEVLASDPSGVLIDPTFWRALGKEMAGTNFETAYSRERGSYSPMESWRLHWHRFIDHIAEGKDVDSFFDQLLAPSGDSVEPLK